MCCEQVQRNDSFGDVDAYMHGRMRICAGQEGTCSLSAAEIRQEPLELNLNPQSQGSSGGLQ